MARNPSLEKNRPSIDGPGSEFICQNNYLQTIAKAGGLLNVQNWPMVVYFLAFEFVCHHWAELKRPKEAVIVYKDGHILAHQIAAFAEIQTLSVNNLAGFKHLKAPVILFGLNMQDVRAIFFKLSAENLLTKLNISLVGVLCLDMDSTWRRTFSDLAAIDIKEVHIIALCQGEQKTFKMGFLKRLLCSLKGGFLRFGEQW
ncbi:MAG: hypothetical protein PHF79_02410 [Candidatus Pacebacteria bacterium]|nr:hypothetical protein [Candidatus Paceibacterota bacterium]